MYNEVQESTKTQTETQDLSVLNERFAVANNYLTLLKNVRIQQVGVMLRFLYPEPLKHYGFKSLSRNVKSKNIIENISKKFTMKYFTPLVFELESGLESK